MRKSVFVTIIGDQPAPNIFLIRDEYFRNVNRYLFLTTDLMESRNKLKLLVAALALKANQYHEVKVSADDPRAIRAKLETLNLGKTGERFLVNITSGSKIMSISLFNFFTSTHLKERTEIFYLSIRDRHFLRIHPEEKYEALKLSHKIALKEYLISYGVYYRYGTGQPKYSRVQSEKIYKSFLELKLAFSELRFKTKKITQNPNKRHQHFDLSDAGAAVQLVKTIGFETSIPGKLEYQEIKYLTGEWFEEWVYYQIKQFLGLAEREIACSLHLEQAEGLKRSEFDVLFLYRDQLYVLECKSGLPKDYGAAKQAFDNAVLRLAALRSDFGLKVNAVFLTLSRSLRRKKKPEEFNPSFISKALSLQVQFLDIEDLQKPPQEWIPLLFTSDRESIS